MLFIILLCSLVVSFECIDPDSDVNPNDRVVVKLDPDQVVGAFKSAMSTEYLRGIAHVLAVKAAEQFMKVMENVKQQPRNGAQMGYSGNRLARLKASLVRPPKQPKASMKAEVVQEIERTQSQFQEPAAADLNTSIIDVKQAMTLIKDPSPDGDNLDLISPNLSEDEELKEKKKSKPVIHLMKVNGKYVRRLLGFV